MERLNTVILQVGNKMVNWECGYWEKRNNKRKEIRDQLSGWNFVFLP